MRKTLKISGINDPIRKYSVFMGIVSLFKGTVEQLGTLNKYRELREKILRGEL
jgi:hypothetical protein